MVRVPLMVLGLSLVAGREVGFSLCSVVVSELNGRVVALLQRGSV